MTYSETREMYTHFYASRIEERRERTVKILNSFKLLFSWLIPWAFTTLCIIALNGFDDSRGLLLSFVILALSFSFFISAERKEHMYSCFWVLFSYLTALSAALTVVTEL